jgi:hypothetical protein
VIATINIFDHSQNQFVPYKFLIDSLSSAFWLISAHCDSELCNQHKKYFPVHGLRGEASIELNNGKIQGNVYFTSVNLKSFTINDQSILLVNSIDVPEFEVNIYLKYFFEIF